MKMENSGRMHWKIVGISAVYSILFFMVFGIVTAIIPNDFFGRMSPVGMPEYVFLILTSLLLGTYMGLHEYQKRYGSKKCDAAAVAGGVGGFLGFGCAMCNKILILLLGAAGVLTYIEPYQSVIGFIGVGLLSYAVYGKWKDV